MINLLLNILVALSFDFYLPDTSTARQAVNLRIEEMTNLIKENYRGELKILLRAPTGLLYAKRKEVIEKEFRKRLPYHERKASVVQEFIGREEIPTLGIRIR